MISERIDGGIGDSIDGGIAERIDGGSMKDSMGIGEKIDVCMLSMLCLYVCMYVCMYLCLYVCMYVYMYVCMYVCMYEGHHPAIILKGQALEEVDSFSYLGSEVQQTSRAEKDVKTRIERAATVYQMWRRKLFRSRTSAEEPKCRCFGQRSCRCYYMEQRPGQ